MPKGINYPLYIPPSCDDVVPLIESLQSGAAIELLWQKARAGESEAAALLVYIHLHGAAPKAGFREAFVACKAGAESGNAYAQLATAQVCESAANYPDATRWLQLACDQQFLPAIVQKGRRLTFGIGMPKPDRSAGLRMYWTALRRGHLCTLVLISKNLISSRNPALWLGGVLLSPIAVAVGLVSLLRFPFGLRTFVHLSGNDPPLFVQPKTKQPVDAASSIKGDSH